ncbi:PepSY-associated TM helix domain-containing protein [Bradyrhizobium sp. 2TAF24]|uniref:PepSY-associated TM helix domain-containing protein n=1 Tax=Bradyrhizobium sp. 2TAF24 TaxID=3233011 RepID=UPI003F913F91
MSFSSVDSVVALPSSARRRWTVRPWLVRAHRWMGLTLAGVLVIAGLTGAILAFDDELDAWLNPALFRATSGAILPIDRLIVSVESHDPRAEVARIGFPTPSRGSVLMTVAARDPAVSLGYDQVFVDPASGQILGQRDSTGCCLAAPVLVPFLFRLHYTLGIGPAGERVMGIVALLWCVDCLVALCLTFPRSRPFLGQWRPAFGIKPTRNSFRLTFDIHRAGGLWCWVCLLAVAVSGVALTLRTEVFQPAVQAMLPVTPDRDAPPTPPSEAIGFTTALRQAADVAPGRRPADAHYLQGAGLYLVAMAAPERGVWTGLGPDIVWIAARDGSVLRIDSDARRLSGDAVLALQYPLHSGRIAGLPSRLLVSALGIAVAVLSLTGPWLWWRKRRAASAVRR